MHEMTFFTLSGSGQLRTHAVRAATLAEARRLAADVLALLEKGVIGGRERFVQSRETFGQRGG